MRFERVLPRPWRAIYLIWRWGGGRLRTQNVPMKQKQKGECGAWAPHGEQVLAPLAAPPGRAHRWVARVACVGALALGLGVGDVVGVAMAATPSTPSTPSPAPATSPSARQLAAGVPVTLSDSERAYLSAHNPVTLCTDPDWWPFEVIDPNGQHQGIAAELLGLVSERTGVQFVLVPTRNWEESVAASKAGRCLVMSFLNDTPDRRQWLRFTEPVLIDPNVLITREEHPFIANLAALKGQTIALPKATAMHERITREFTNLKVLDTNSEPESLGWVSERKADMTLRSLIVAAHTIKSGGWFNLKISGLIPGYENRLRMGVLHSETTLRDILDKGVASLTDEDRRQAVDKHVSMKVVTDVKRDDTLVIGLGVVLLSVLATSLWWMRKLRAINRQLKDLAQTDPLTGLFNRNGLYESFASDVARALRYGRPLSVILLDIDHFKRVNDELGHLVGDKVLMELGALIKRTIRGVDTVCRWGGEEFVVICHETPVQQAQELAERLLQAARTHAFAAGRPVTLSAGVTDLAQGDTPDTLVQRADEAMYQAKHAGRDRVCVQAVAVPDVATTSA